MNLFVTFHRIVNIYTLFLWASHSITVTHIVRDAHKRHIEHCMHYVFRFLPECDAHRKDAEKKKKIEMSKNWMAPFDACTLYHIAIYLIQFDFGFDLSIIIYTQQNMQTQIQRLEISWQCPGIIHNILRFSSSILLFIIVFHIHMSRPYSFCWMTVREYTT